MNCLFASIPPQRQRRRPFAQEAFETERGHIIEDMENVSQAASKAPPQQPYAWPPLPPSSTNDLVQWFLITLAPADSGRDRVFVQNHQQDARTRD